MCPRRGPEHLGPPFICILATGYLERRPRQQRRAAEKAQRRQKGALVADIGVAPQKGLDRSGRLHELDGLRAVAIALVVIHHSATGPITRALADTSFRPAGDALFFITGSGVELFFVLSSIVLLRPYLRRERHFRTAVYLRRRFERLWPPYLVALVFAGFVAFIGQLHPTWYSEAILPKFSGRGWLAQLGILNLGWPMYSNAWWSLNLEVVFYLLVPVIIAVVVGTRPHTAWLAIFVGLTVTASLLTASLSSFGDAYLRAAAVPGGDGRQGFWEVIQAFLIYSPSFAFGAAIARFRFSSRFGVLLTAFAAGYCLLALRYPPLNVHLGLALLYSGIVVLAVEGSGWLRGRLSKPFLVWLGERSYSLFLIHFPVFYLTNYFASLVLSERGATYFILTRLAGIPLAFLAAMVIFALVERRFARGLTTGDRFWPWTSAA